MTHSWTAKFETLCLVLCTLCPAVPASARAASDPQRAVGVQAADLDLEQLANTDVIVTSASKHEQILKDAPAAIYVLTAEDIRRGGFSSLPEALRLVPGLYVARTNSHSWVISARGFSDLQNNKLLVLVDGRSVYTPLYGGVFWDVLDIPLENIDRVEVIRGPGGALWGANAVNGVINIVTRRSQSTQGILVSTSADVEEGYTATVQYGGGSGQSLHYRIFGKASYWEPFESQAGLTLPNSFALPQAGARVDWTASDRDSVTLDVGAYDGRFQSTGFNSSLPETYLVKGNHLLGRWEHKISHRSHTETVGTCDWYARQGVPTEMRNTCSFDFQHSYDFSARHSLIWGASVLSTADDLSDDPATYDPVRRRTSVAGGFAQYEFAVVPNRVRLLAGAKLERNGYSGFEYQPQVRAVWTPGRQHTLWGSFARAIRVPSRNVTDIYLLIPVGMQDGKPVFSALVGNPALESEHLQAYEIGYRYRATEALSFDIATYYNRYCHLIAGQNSTVQVLPTMIILNVPYGNGDEAQTHGLEVSAKWRPARRWLLSGGLSETRGSDKAALPTPRHLFNLQSRVDLPHHLEFSAGLYHYGAVPAQPSQNATGKELGAIPRFDRVDTGLIWHLSPQWTFAVWARNLQSDRHVETADSIFGGTAGTVPRSVALQLTWHFLPEKSDGH